MFAHFTADLLNRCISCRRISIPLSESNEAGGHKSKLFNL